MVLAQLPNFSGFWLTPQLTAPTAMAGDDAYQVTAHYRRQGFEENTGYRTYLVSGQIPFYNRSNNHFSTLGVSVMKDESGSSYLFSTSGAMLTYMYDATLARRHHLVAGLQGAYYGRKIDWSKVTTNNQFSNGFFDPAISVGENISDDPSYAFLANAGLSYYITDFQGTPVFHLGAALANANRGSFHYLTDGENRAVPAAVSAFAHLRVLSNSYFDVVSDVYWQNKSSVSDIVGGLRLRKGINPRVSIPDSHFGVGLYYSQDHTGIIALQLLQSNWLLGISYDMVFGNRPLRGVQNAVEVSLGWRLVREDKKVNYNPKKYRKKLPWKKKRRLPWQ